jgi:hypothetical protein
MVLGGLQSLRNRLEIEVGMVEEHELIERCLPSLSR